MKRLLAMLLSFAMVLGLCACGSAQPKETEATQAATVSAPVVLDDSGNSIGGYKIGFFYLPESDGLSAQYHRALNFCAELTNCEMEYYDMMNWSAEDLSTAVETLIANGCQGVIMITGNSPALFQYMNEKGVYYTGLTRSYTDEVALVVDGSEYNCGWLDENSGLNVDMGYGVTAALAEKGCKNIAYVAGAPGNQMRDDRVLGIEKAAEEFGMNIVTSYRGSDFASGTADILATHGAELDGMVGSINGDVCIAAINSAGYADTIRYAQIDAPSAEETESYFRTGHIDAVTAGNNVFIVQSYMQLFNALSGADRLFNEGNRVYPMIPNFIVSDEEGWQNTEKYTAGDVPALTPDEILALNSLYTPDTTVEQKEALVEKYCSSEYWNLDSIVARVKDYLGEN